MTRYYHGGHPGLRPGDLILPPDVTGTERTLSRYAAELGGAPQSDPEPDPDCSEPGLSWQCPAAQIVAVIDACVLFRARSPERWLRLLHGHQ